MKLLNESRAWKVISLAWKKYSKTGHQNEIAKSCSGLCYSIKILVETSKINEETCCSMNRKIREAINSNERLNYYYFDIRRQFLFNLGREFANHRAEFAEKKYKEMIKS